MKSTDPPIIVDQIFDQTIDLVWSSITEHDLMIQWFFENIPDFKAKVGFKTQFNVQAPSRDFMHIWEVTEVIPNQFLAYKWNFEGLAGESYSIFELEEINDKTKLTLTAEVSDDFDESIPEFKRESGVAGWNYFIKERLTEFLKNY